MPIILYSVHVEKADIEFYVKINESKSWPKLENEKRLWDFVSSDEMFSKNTTRALCYIYSVFNMYL